MQIRILGAHNLQSSCTRQSAYLVDGVLAVDMGGFSSALNAAEQGEVRAILLTHRHFDHTRDIPTLGLMTLDDPKQIDVYSLPETLEGVRTHLLDGDIYPDFTKKLTDAPPKYRFHPIEPEVPFQVLNYQIKAIPQPHPVSSVGFIVKSDSGSCWAYTGDTGGNLLPFFQESELAPQALFIDVTFPSRSEYLAKLTGHLTPSLLREQILEVRKANLNLPKMIAVHIHVPEREEVVEEVESLGKELGIDLSAGVEGMAIDL